MLQRAAPLFILLNINGKDIEKWWLNLPAVAHSPKGKTVDPSDPLVAVIDAGLITREQIIQAVWNSRSIIKVSNLKFNQDQLDHWLGCFKVSMAKDSTTWVAILNCTNYKLPHDFDQYGTANLVIAEDDPTFGSSTTKIDALQFRVAIAEFALKGSAMPTQALHHVMTPDAQELFLRESDLLSPDKNMFHTILMEIFSTFLSRTVSAMFTSEAHVNLLCTMWDCQIETLYPIISRIRDLEWYIDNLFSKCCCCHLLGQLSFKNRADYSYILAELSPREELDVAAFA
jgi:hypothetical protein